ncbi:thiaminase (transcriptional activator TenA) [Franzmannia pantelleriensis]|uniref:Aminopyrimidine aminohydrolase n=1 Tax=Franzmannia pantelleriensis TaxID=48727 RepID=A0A1G9IIK3_9GAMM|nr:TenA family protein [Halomonas pantelleriensis]SDL24734.1 thiaminase (transcriptional activator TenA) [Halomonas pantelleriensis]
MSTLEQYHDWAAGRTASRVSDWLKEISEPDWTATVEHPLFDALAEARLPEAEFAAYMVQDYGFVDPFTALIGHAIGHAPSMGDRVVLGQFMGMLTSDENSTFQRTFETFGVAGQAPDYLPETRAFQQLLRDTGQRGGYAEMLAVLVVTEWLYLGWATRITRAESLHPLYAEWIDLHDSAAFQDFVAWLRRRLDEEAAQLDPAGFAAMAARFRDTVTKERAFHDAVHSR